MGPWYLFWQTLGATGLDRAAAVARHDHLRCRDGRPIHAARAALGTAPGLTVAAFAYALSPYLLHYGARISVILLPLRRAPVADRPSPLAPLRRGGWRWPAGVRPGDPHRRWCQRHLVAAGDGGSSAVPGARRSSSPGRPLCATPSAPGCGSARSRSSRRCGGSRAWRCRAHTGSRSCATPRPTTRSPTQRCPPSCCAVSATGSSTAATPSARGSHPPSGWSSRSRHSILSFTIPGLAMVSGFIDPLPRTGATSRCSWPPACVIGVGAHPWDSSSPAGAVFEAWTGTDSGLAFRSTPRAVPLIALGLSVMLAAGLAARRRQVAGLATPGLGGSCWQ